MDEINDKFYKIRALVLKRFAIKMSGFSLLFLSGIAVPFIAKGLHMFNGITIGGERPENIYAILALGIGLLGIITSIQYLYNSMKLLKEKLKKDQSDIAANEGRQTVRL